MSLTWRDWAVNKCELSSWNQPLISLLQWKRKKEKVFISFSFEVRHQLLDFGSSCRNWKNYRYQIRCKGSCTWTLCWTNVFRGSPPPRYWAVSFRAIETAHLRTALNQGCWAPHLRTAWNLEPLSMNSIFFLFLIFLYYKNGMKMLSNKYATWGFSKNTK